MVPPAVLGMVLAILAHCAAGAPESSVTPNAPLQGDWNAAGKNGVVAAGSPQAVAAGIEIRAAGGNAADAADATIFALNITDHGYCSIGAEVPLIVWDAK